MSKYSYLIIAGIVAMMIVDAKAAPRIQNGPQPNPLTPIGQCAKDKERYADCSQLYSQCIKIGNPQICKNKECYCSAMYEICCSDANMRRKR